MWKFVVRMALGQLGEVLAEYVSALQKADATRSELLQIVDDCVRAVEWRTDGIKGLEKLQTAREQVRTRYAAANLIADSVLNSLIEVAVVRWQFAASSGKPWRPAASPLITDAGVGVTLTKENS